MTEFVAFLRRIGHAIKYGPFDIFDIDLDDLDEATTED